MASFSEALHKKHLISDFIPALGPNIKVGWSVATLAVVPLSTHQFQDRLEQGGMMCLDVGCGKGFHAALLGNEVRTAVFKHTSQSGRQIWEYSHIASFSVIAVVVS